MSNRVHFIHHNGVDILYIDWSSAASWEIREAMHEAKEIIAAQPRASVRTLTNVTDVHMDNAATEMLRDYMAHNKPYVLAGAVVGLNDLKMIAFNLFNRVTGRSLRAMDNLDDAKDWLAAARGRK
ncbi:MAG TPA: hypothetical protein VEU30_07420 [Thermoanaerobaculia bacterium]|nr:hypothetical protein [Thermoanaerobaculia bacterium]